MAISVNWVTGRIFIPKADTTYIGLNPFSQEVRELDMDQLRLTLRGLEDDPDGGRIYPKTHDHGTQELLAGINFIRKIKLLAPYYVEIEAGNYRVNLTAENNNLVDRLYHNGVTVVPQNSAGGQVVETGTSGLTQPESDQLFKSDYKDGVWMDTSGSSEQTHPIGTQDNPVNNITNAKAIVEKYSAPKKINLTSNYVFDGDPSIDGYKIKGVYPFKQLIEIDNGNVSMEGTKFEGFIIGPLFPAGIITSENIEFENCYFNTITPYSGFGGTCVFKRCRFSPAGHVFSTSKTGEYKYYYSESDLTLDFRYSEQHVHVYENNGEITLKNLNIASCFAKLYLKNTPVTINSSCTLGFIEIYGASEVTDNSGAGCTVTIHENKLLVDIETEVMRVLGLVNENSYLDQTVYIEEEGQKLMTSARLRIYSVAGSVGGDNDVTDTYEITATYTGLEMDDYKMVRQ